MGQNKLPKWAKISCQTLLFEQIRREYEFGTETIAGTAKKLKVHRRMVREVADAAQEGLRWKLAAVAFSAIRRIGRSCRD